MEINGGCRYPQNQAAMSRDIQNPGEMGKAHLNQHGVGRGRDSGYLVVGAHRMRGKMGTETQGFKGQRD